MLNILWTTKVRNENLEKEKNKKAKKSKFYAAREVGLNKNIANQHQMPLDNR